MIQFRLVGRSQGLRLRLRRLYGRLRQRLRSVPETQVGPVPAPLVTETPLEILRWPTDLGRCEEVALLVAHVPQGRFKPQVRDYVEALEAEGITCIVIAAVDTPLLPDQDWVLTAASGLVLRQNSGFDFAAWAHILRRFEGLLAVPRLYLTNDSILGPVSRSAFRSMLQRLRQHPSEIIGLTGSFEQRWHLQSYFLALRSTVFGRFNAVDFWLQVRNHADVQTVIDHYEVAFTERMERAGIACAVLYPQPRAWDGRNPTLYHWRALLRQGFPFVKVSLLTGRYPHISSAGLLEALQEHGYPAGTLRALLASLGQSSPGSLSLLPAVTTMPEPPLPRLDYLGPWNYANGLGVAARGLVSALWHSGLAVNLRPVRRPFHVHQQTTPARDVCDFDGPADLALIHLNPDAWSGLLTEADHRRLQAARYRVGYWVWETSEIPPVWQQGLEQVDAVWTPSQYCADLLRSFTDRPIRVLPHVVPVLPPAPEGRSAPWWQDELGIAPTDLLLGYAFDGSSFLDRKNPLALVRAFRASGLGDQGVRLLLKTKHLREHPLVAAELDRAVAGDAAIRVVDQVYAPDRQRELMAGIDIYCSPHRSEGFGLTVAEAMAAGKLVVATDYGGPRDWLTSDCGFPVACREVTLERDIGPYRAGSRWAEVDEEHLCDQLQRAVELWRQPDQRRQLATRAQAQVGDRLSAARVGELIRHYSTELLQSAREGS